VDQFYNMWFNQALFTQAGIKTPPTTWSEMMSDCSLLKSKGITPLALGSPTFLTPGGGAVFDWSYLAGGAYPLSDWNKLLNGTLPYSSPALVKQVQSWAALYSAGCTSTNVTTQNSDTLFTSGQVAMVMNYNGLYPTYFKALGSKLGVMIPPWSESPQQMLVQLPGAGYGVAKSSSNAKLAAEFVASTVSAESQQLVASSGGLPVIKDVKVDGVMGQLLTWAQSGQYKLYPMFDNFMQQSVVAQMNSQLPEAFVGHKSAADALSTFDQALASLPDADRNVSYNLGAG
jgi:ABC-type glycerol-3-phosphate transport system substrate-binding protein